MVTFLHMEFAEKKFKNKLKICYLNAKKTARTTRGTKMFSNSEHATWQKKKKKKKKSGDYQAYVSNCTNDIHYDCSSFWQQKGAREKGI